MSGQRRETPWRRCRTVTRLALRVSCRDRSAAAKRETQAAIIPRFLGAGSSPQTRSAAGSARRRSVQSADGKRVTSAGEPGAAELWWKSKRVLELGHWYWLFATYCATPNANVQYQ